MSQMDSHKRKHEKQERGEPSSVSPNRDGNHHHPVPPVPMNLPPTSPGMPGLTYNNVAMYLPSTGSASEYEHPAVNLDSSLNLGMGTNSPLFFLKNAAGLGLSDSMDLSKKMHREPLSLIPGSGPAASMGLTNPQDDTTGTSGDPEDDLSAEEEPIAEEDDDDYEEEEEEREEDMNTDSYEDSMPDNGESFNASMNHTETSRLDKEERETEP